MFGFLGLLIAIWFTWYLFIKQNKVKDVAGELEKLAELKEKGILTESEFKEQKKKLLE